MFVVSHNASLRLISDTFGQRCKTKKCCLGAILIDTVTSRVKNAPTGTQHCSNGDRKAKEHST